MSTQRVNRVSTGVSTGWAGMACLVAGSALGAARRLKDTAPQHTPAEKTVASLAGTDLVAARVSGTHATSTVRLDQPVSAHCLLVAETRLSRQPRLQ